MVTIFRPVGGVTLDFEKPCNIDDYHYQKSTKKNTQLYKERKKLAPLDLYLVNKLRDEALKKEDDEHIIKFGKFKGIHYNDLLREDMIKYRKFLKRCPFRNVHIEHFLKWVEEQEKKDDEKE